jgi:hypothetical protein
VIAGREEVDAASEQLLSRLFGETEPAGQILAVGDREVDVVLLAQQREVLRDRFASRRADDIGQREYRQRARS